MTLTKADLIQRIADQCGFLKGEATEVFEKLLDIIKKSLIAGEDVMISASGSGTSNPNMPAAAGTRKPASR